MYYPMYIHTYMCSVVQSDGYFAVEEFVSNGLPIIFNQLYIVYTYMHVCSSLYTVRTYILHFVMILGKAAVQTEGVCLLNGRSRSTGECVHVRVYCMSGGMCA